MNAMYNSAKIEKLKQLKKLMYELLGSDMGEKEEEMLEGEMPVEKMSIKAPMAAAEAEMNGTEPLKSIDEEAGEDDGLSELEQMKRDYFKKKPAATRRPGTAIIVAKESISAKPMPKQMMKGFRK